MTSLDYDDDDYIPARTEGEWRLPPGLKRALPFYFRRKWVNFGEPIPLFEHLHRTFGRIAHYRFMGTTIVFVNDPEWIAEILINQAPSFIKERTLQRMKILLGEGLITSDDPIHMRQRRIAAPAFHRQRIAGYADQIVASAETACAGWTAGQQIDIAAAMMQLSLNIIARTLFDTEVTPEVLSIADEVNTIMGLYNFLVAFPRLESVLHWPIPGIMQFRRSRARLDTIVARMISSRRAQPRAELEARTDLLSMLVAAHDEESEALQTRRPDPTEPRMPHSTEPGVAHSCAASSRMGGVQNASTAGVPHSTEPGVAHSCAASSRMGGVQNAITASNRGMTDTQVRDEVLTIFLAGYETVANALTWTWYLLSRNPDAAARMQREIDEVLNGAPATVESYPHLKYTEMVFAESMRLYPPAWAMGRRSTKPVTLGEYKIPPGAHFFFSQYVLHRSPEFWPDPLAFRPERHTPEGKAARPRFVYFPFGGGRRQCIGEGFAWMEGVLSLATIAQRWRLTFVPTYPVILQAKITLRPRFPMMMRIEPQGQRTVTYQPGPKA